MTRVQIYLAILAPVLGVTGWLMLEPEETPPVSVRRMPGRAPASPVGAVSASGRLASVPTAASAPAARMAWGDLPRTALVAWAAAPAAKSTASAKAADAASAPSAEAPRPAAPPFPYQWIGQMADANGVVTALLNGSQRSLGVHAGEVLDGRWRVDRVTNDRIDLTWMPTGDGVVLNKR